MTRRITTGFEELDQFVLWDTVYAADNDVTFVQWERSPRASYQVPEPRTGRGMFRSGNALAFVRNDTLDHPTELYFGVAVYAPRYEGVNWLVAYTDDNGVYSNYLSLQTLGNGVINVTRTGTVIASSAVGTMTLNTWHYVEVWFKPLNANGRVVVIVDGSTVIDFTGDTTAEEEYISAYLLQGTSNDTLYYTCFDDFVVNDSAGASNNTYPGQVRLMPIKPASAGNYAQWDRGGVDLGTDAAQVRNSYSFSLLQTSTADEYVTFIPDIPDLPAGATIQNIIVEVRAKVEAGAGVVAPMIRQNGVDDIGSDFTLGTGFEITQEVYPVNPDTAVAWVEADLADLEIGVSS